MADQVHQHGLCLMGKPDKGRIDGRNRLERQTGAPRLHRRFQDLLLVSLRVVDHAPPNRAARRRPTAVLPIKVEKDCWPLPEPRTHNIANDNYYQQ